MIAQQVDPTCLKPIESPTMSGNSKDASSKYETQATTITTERVNRGKQDKKLASSGEGPNRERGMSITPFANRKGCEQPAITSFIIKSPMKKRQKKTHRSRDSSNQKVKKK